MLQSVAAVDSAAPYAPTFNSASAMTPASKSTLASMWVRLLKGKSLALSVALLGSHLAFTWSTWLTVAVSWGRSKKAPAPTEPAFSRKAISRRSWGLKAAERVRLMLSIWDWKGKGEICVSWKPEIVELGGSLMLRVREELSGIVRLKP